MESELTSKTLAEGFVESKRDDKSCVKIVEEVNTVCLSNLNEKGGGDVYVHQTEASHVELAREFGNDSVKESLGFDRISGINQMNEWPLNVYPGENLSVLTRGNDLSNNDFSVLEGDLEFGADDAIQVGKIDKLVESLSMTRGNDMSNNDLSFSEGDLKFSGIDVTQTGKIDKVVEKCDDASHSHEIEKIDELMEKGDHLLHPHEAGSPTKIEVSGNSINLFVEVFGPLNGTFEGCNNLDDAGEHKLGESDSNQEISLNENGNIYAGVEDVSDKNEREDIAGEQEYLSKVGDLVWVKTRAQSWWPGLISDPSSAPNDTMKCEKSGSFLVKYFGSPNFLWCENSSLKPFIECFERMSRQNNSPNFCGAVERALCEIGQRVKARMTCPCFAKDSQRLDEELATRNKEEKLISTQKASEFDVLSISMFEPATFLARVKNIAHGVQVPGKIEFTEMKSQLSSFYCSIGHLELPLQLLRSGSDSSQIALDRLTSEVADKDDINTSRDGRNSVEARGDDLTITTRKKKRKNHSDDCDNLLGDKIADEPRARKKSRYLSYPYVDVNEELKTASTAENEKEKEGLSLNKKSTLSSRKMGTRKPLKGHCIVSKTDAINVSPAELLAELRSATRGCYLSGSKCSDSLKRFYTSFRQYAYVGADVACEDARDQQEPSLEKRLLQNSAEAEVQIEGKRAVKESGKQKVSLASGKKSVENILGSKSSETDNLQAKKNCVYSRSKKKKEKVTKSQKQMEGIKVTKESENQKVSLASVEESVENIFGGKSLKTPPAKELVICLKAKKRKEKVPKSQEQMKGIKLVQESENQKGNVASGKESVLNAVGEKLLQTENSQVNEKDVCKKAQTEKEQLISGVGSTQNSISMGTNIYPNTSLMISFEQACSIMMQSGTTSNMSGGVTPGLADICQTAVLPDLNGNLLKFSVGEPSRSLGEPEQRNQLFVCPNINGVGQMIFTPVSSPKVAPVTPQSTQQLNYQGNSTNRSRDREFKAGESESNVVNLSLSSSAQHSLQTGIFSSAGKPEPKKRKRKEKTSQVASVIPDLNGNAVDMNSSEKSTPDPNGDTPKKKQSSSSVEDLGGTLVLDFAPGSALPSKETLVATFSRFGLLKESEIKVLTDSSVQIVYERSSDARFAFGSMGKRQPFGESLVNYNLHGTPATLKPKKKKNVQAKSFVPVDERTNRAKPVEVPGIAFMKEKVEEMKLNLEKVGNNLSPEIRAKLENDIKSFLNKISSMSGSSST